MQVGKLRERIVLESQTSSAAQGNVKEIFVPVATVWGEVISQKGETAFEAARNNAKSLIRVRIRYRDDLTSKWRISWRNQYYKINGNIDRSQPASGYMWFTAEISSSL